MTEQERNLEATKRLYAICAEGDWAAVREMLHDDFFATEAPGLPYEGVFRGKDGLQNLFVKVMSMVDLTGMDLIEMTVGGDWVIALVEMHARDADGDFTIELAEGSRFQDGKVCEIRPYYFDPALVHRAVRAKQAATGSVTA
jgi:ketosteroid isomerase-like protein